MIFKEKIKSLTILRRQHLEELLAVFSRSSLIIAFLNLILIVLVRFKNILLRKRDSVLFGRGAGGRGFPVIDSHRSLDLAMNIPPRIYVLLVVEESIPHCFRYRVQQKIEQLELAGMVVHWVSWKDSCRVSLEIHFCHVVIFYRAPAFHQVCLAIAQAKALNKVVIYDIDDLIFDRKVMEANLELFKGLPQTEVDGLILGARLYRQAIKLCRYAIGSTPALCEQLELVGPRTFLHRNVLDRRIETYLAKENCDHKKDKDSITIFYGSGTKTHDSDFEMAGSSLLRIMEEFSHVRLIIAGFLNIPDGFVPYADRIIRLDFLSSESYWHILRQIDINIAPLQGNVFSDCKSEIKWLEAAIFRIPSVVSNTRSYAEVLRDGQDVFLAASSQEWYEKTVSLVLDSAFRQRMAANAYTLALANYSLATSSQNLLKIIQNVMAREERRGVVTFRPPPRRKIIYVNVLYPPQELGGATVIVKNHLASIRKRYGKNFELAVFTVDIVSETPYLLKEHIHDSIHVTSIGIPNSLDIDWRYADDKVGALFRRYVEVQQPDLIHFHCVQRLTASILEVSRQQDIPYFVTLHDAWWLCDRQFMINDRNQDCGQYWVNPLVCASCVEDLDGSLARRTFLSEQLRNADLLLAVSSYQLELYRQNGFDNIVLNKNGIHKPGHKISSAGGGSVRIGYVGGVSRHKGYYFLKEVVEKLELNNVEFQVVDFTLSPGQERHVTWGTTPVRYIPKLAFDEMAAFWHRIDVVVVPSIWRESFGLVAREAIANGVWAVVADAGGLAEDIVDGSNGYVFPMGNAGELSEILLAINGSAGFCGQGSDIGIDNIVSLDKQVDELVDLYCQYLNVSRGGDDGDGQATAQPTFGVAKEVTPFHVGQ